MISGADYLRRGFGLWRTRPRLMLFASLPALLVLGAMVALLVALMWNLGDLVATLTPFADDLPELVGEILRFLLGALIVLAAVMLSMVSFTWLTLLVGDPFYERVWRATELMLTGTVPDQEPGLWVSVRDSARLMGLGLLTTVFVVLLGLLPVLGTGIGLLLGIVVSGRLLAAELLGRPLAARGLDRRARGELLRSRRSAVLGFGMATQGFFLIPFGAIVAMPAAVAGATMLAHDLLPHRPG